MPSRDANWWIFREEVADDLLAAASSYDWAVFSNGRQDTDAPPPVALAIGRSADGRLICTGMLIGLNEAYPLGNNRFGEPMEVTSRDLRGIPVAELIGKAVHAAPAHHELGARFAEARARDLAAVRRSPGPKGHPDEHFQWVADMYRRALEARPDAPVVWLTEQLDRDRSTVNRWLQRARDKGYLGEATPGRAGEKPTVEES